MKVMCINDSASSNPDFGNWNPLEYGKVYNAFQCPLEVRNFVLQEIPKAPNGDFVSFRKSRFAPLSDLDETVIHAERFQPEPLNV